MSTTAERGIMTTPRAVYEALRLAAEEAEAGLAGSDLVAFILQDELGDEPDAAREVAAALVAELERLCIAPEALCAAAAHYGETHGIEVECIHCDALIRLDGLDPDGRCPECDGDPVDFSVRARSEGERRAEANYGEVL